MKTREHGIDKDNLELTQMSKQLLRPETQVK